MAAHHNARRRAARLFALYAAASLIPVALLGLVLGHSYGTDGTEHALEQGRAQAQVIGQMAIAPALKGADPRLRLTQQQRDALWAATDLAVFRGSVRRLRIASFTGRIVFSDDGRHHGRLDPGTAAFGRAMAGTPVASIPQAHGGARTIRVLAPIVTTSSGRAVGILEVRLPYDAIARSVEQNTRQGFLRLGLGLLALYLVLALISWWSTRALVREATDHEHQAHHDALTGLPNRQLFHRLAEQALAESSPHRKGGLVLVDLNRFKEVNDTLGHHAGDELLQIMARRLEQAFRADDVVARLGGDEFAILLRRIHSDEDAIRLLERIREKVRADVRLDGIALQVDASLGLCIFPDDATDLEGLLQRADAAMYEGKRGPSNVVKYRSSIAGPDTSSLVLQRELAEALVDDQLFLEYQPKIDLRSGAVVGVEALVRWQHPRDGRVMPDTFVPIAERTQQIDQLTRWVLDAALRDCARWRAEGLPWSVAVNASSRNLSDPRFVTEILSALDRHQVPPEKLVLEITETATPFDSAVLRHVAAALEEARVRVSLDDFGAGVTNLAQLRSIPISELKIDRQFVDRLDQQPANAAIVASMIDLGHRLGCTVTAEGVDSPEVASWLRDNGCDLGQGYFWMRPTEWRTLRDNPPVYLPSTVPPDFLHGAIT